MRRMRPFAKKSEEAERPAQTNSPLPHLILAGVGIHDRLLMTVETQRTVARYGKAFAIGLQPALRAFLKSLHVEVVDLDDRFAAHQRFEEVYLDIVAHLIERTAVERPVILLCPGNPLFLNSVARALVVESRRLGLTLQLLPGVSLLDVLINDIGIDVGQFGLQVFDAHWLVVNALPLSIGAPVLILNLAGFGLDSAAAADRGPDYGPLTEYLGRYYGPEQVITLVRSNPSGGVSFGRLRLDGLTANAEALAAATCLHIDFVAAAPEQDAPRG